MTVTHTPTFQDTDDHFLGSGALDFHPWYTNISTTDATDTESWTLTFTDPADEPADDVAATERTITHADIMRAVGQIADGTVEMREEYREECQLFESGELDAVDFDAISADVVIQVAAFGKVVYG
jgi:hypothetical protein